MVINGFYYGGFHLIVEEFDKERLDADPLQPLANDPSCKLRPVVRSDIFRCPMTDEQSGKAFKDIIGSQASLRDNSQTLNGLRHDLTTSETHEMRQAHGH